NAAISPHPPAKPVPDDTSYSAPAGGVVATRNLQVLAGNAGQLLTMDLDDANPNSPGSTAEVFNGTGTTTINIAESALVDGFHGEGVACPFTTDTPTPTPTPTTPTPTPTSPTPTPTPATPTPTAACLGTWTPTPTATFGPGGS